MDTYAIDIDADSHLLPTARMFAATVARQFGCAEDSVLDVKIAVSEACANAVQAHQEHDVAAPIHLSVEEDEQGLTYQIEDSGPGFDPEPEPPRAVFQRAVEGSEQRQGMGLALIRSLFPSAQFARSGHGMVVSFHIDR